MPQRAPAARRTDDRARTLSWLLPHPWCRAGTGPAVTCQHPCLSKPLWTKRHPSVPAGLRTPWEYRFADACSLPAQQAGHAHAVMLADGDRYECAMPRVRGSCSLNSQCWQMCPRGTRHSVFLNGRAYSRASPPLKEPPWKLDLEIFVANRMDSPALCLCFESAALHLEETRHPNTRDQPKENTVTTVHASGLGGWEGREKK